MFRNTLPGIILAFSILITCSSFAQDFADVNITIVNSDLTRKFLYNDSKSFNPIYDWEIFLLNNKIAYNVIDDHGLDEYDFEDSDVLILPSVEILSREAKENLREYLEQGGGALILGKLGGYNEMNSKDNTDLLYDLASISAKLLPERESPSLKLMLHKSSIINNSSTSAEILILNQLPSYYDQSSLQYNRVMADFSSGNYNEMKIIYSGISLSEKNNCRIIWYGFHLSQMSYLENNAKIKDEIILNSLMWLANKPAVWVNNFPNSCNTAVLFSFFIEDIKSFKDNYLFDITANKINPVFIIKPDEIKKSSEYLDVLASIGEIVILFDKLDMLGKTENEIIKILNEARDIIRNTTLKQSIGVLVHSPEFDKDSKNLMDGAEFDFLLDSNFKPYLNNDFANQDDLINRMKFSSINLSTGLGDESVSVFDAKFDSVSKTSDVINIFLPSKQYFISAASEIDFMKEFKSKVEYGDFWETNFSALINQLNNVKCLSSEIELLTDEELITLKISNTSNKQIKQTGLFLSVDASSKNLAPINFYNSPRYDQKSGLYTLFISEISPFQTLRIDFKYIK